MVQDGNKAERLSSVSHTTKFISNKLSIDGRPPFIFQGLLPRVIILL